jgi:integrase/recombinase XerD
VENEMQDNITKTEFEKPLNSPQNLGQVVQSPSPNNSTSIPQIEKTSPAEKKLVPEFEGVLKDLRQELIIEGYSAKTLKMYLIYATEALYFMNKSITQLEKRDVVNYLAHKKETGCSNATLGLIHAALQYLLEKQLKLKILDDIKIPKKAKTLPKVLTKDEIRLLFENTHFGRNRLMLQFMYGSGCRVSEVVKMKIEDLNFKERIATIRGGKGNKDRMIILSKEWLKGLKKYLDKKRIRSEYVFSKKTNGKPLTTDTVQRIVRKAAKDAGINKHVTPHCLRHSYATHLLESGTNIRYIQSLLGHSSLNTTQVYTNVASEQLKKVESPLDKL